MILLNDRLTYKGINNPLTFQGIDDPLTCQGIDYPLTFQVIHWPKMKTLHSIQKYIFWWWIKFWGYLFRSWNLPCLIGVSEKNIGWKHKFHHFHEYFSSEGSKWKILKTIKPVTQILEARNYWLCALSDVKKIICNQCDLHFTNA